MVAPIVIDFETHPIQQRPAYPPEPVGVAIQWPGYAITYYGWGHPTENNCTPQEGYAALRAAWDSGLPLLFHHAKFDLAVAYERLGLPRLPWDRVHDTMFLAYLCDPHARSLGLKELAADLLQQAPEERDVMRDWVWQHRAQLEQTYGGRVKGTHKGGCSNVGEWIWATPGGLCGRYAMGDVARTRALYDHLRPIVEREGMWGAYDRERQVLPIFMENEETGMRVDLERLERDIYSYGHRFIQTEHWLRSKLGASGLNFDADADVANVLLERGIVPVENWQRTAATKSHPNGQLSMSKDNLLPDMFTGPDGFAIAAALGYRNRLKTCLDMFMRPWAAQARVNGGYITTNWNQTRSAGESGGGTRTGRPSTDKHNFLNLSKTWDGRDDGYRHPDWLGVETLPLVRRYIVPDAGETFIHRDFDGQELRLFAHFEQGALHAAYQRDPTLDPHAFIGTELQRVANRTIERTRIKTLNFQSIYGGGVPALQRKLRCTVLEAKELKAFHNNALPGRKILNEEITKVVRQGLPIRTLGGRLYYPEPPGPDGRDKIYKLINYEVQGSAADLTKEAIIVWHSHPLRVSRFMVTVYDEINGSAPKGREAEQQAVMREAMEIEAPRRLGLDVPMRSSGKQGDTWGDLVKCP